MSLGRPHLWLATFVPLCALGALPGCGEREWRPDTSTVVALDEAHGLDLVDDIAGVGDGDGDQGIPARPSFDAQASPAVVYSNFSDGTLNLTMTGTDNAVANQSSICGGAWPKFMGSDAQKADLQKNLQAMMNDFNVVLTMKRPTSGPYSMIVVGPKPSSCAIQGAGVAYLDCGNKNPSNVCFDFNNSGSVLTMAQEIGHTYGLAHTDLGCDVMGVGYTTKSCPSYKFLYTDTDGPVIGTQKCAGSTQNSYQMMKSVLGAWPGDVAHPDPVTGDGSLCTDKAPPTLAFAQPNDGGVVGSNFRVEAKPEDDCGIKTVKIEVPSLSLSDTKMAPPFYWDLTNIDDAPKLEIDLTASDFSGHSAQAKITIKVSAGAGGSGGSGGGNGGSGGGNGGSGGGNGGSGGSHQTGASGGCSIAGASTPGSAPLATLAGLLFTGAAARCKRRRR